ncbi:hypothetical protein [Streptodolium elevatio]|uniref:Uncharacterized protein n=1 Tax=Streptodolium elevatio TaxID=3157996 RepID=A0ABV3DT85_9ACTN
MEQQTEQAWCLTLVTNAVVTWTTEYYGSAVDSMSRSGGASTTRSWPTSPGPQREHQLLRRHRGRHRRRTRPTRPHRIPAATHRRRPVLTAVARRRRGRRPATTNVAIGADARPRRTAQCPGPGAPAAPRSPVGMPLFIYWADPTRASRRPGR